MTARRETPGRRGSASSVTGTNKTGNFAAKGAGPKRAASGQPAAKKPATQKSAPQKPAAPKSESGKSAVLAPRPQAFIAQVKPAVAQDSAPTVSPAKATPKPNTKPTAKVSTKSFPRLTALTETSQRPATGPAKSARSAGKAAADTPQKRPPAARASAEARSEAPIFSSRNEASSPVDLGPPERIAKVLARLGICSRRDAEAMIAEGRVRLNGQVLLSPAVKAGGRDRLEVDEQPVGRRERTRLWLYHKPSGLVTTHKDPQGRRTVFETLPPDLPRVVSIGRLDLTTEGLLLLTNDGELSRALELPSTGLQRSYRARAFGRVTQAQLDGLALGITFEGVNYGSIDAELERVQGGNVWISVRLREGKKREVRFALESLGLQVNRLIRVAYGPFTLDDLQPGQLLEVSEQDIARLLASLKRAQKQAKAEEAADARAAERPDYRAAKRNPGGWEP